MATITPPLLGIVFELDIGATRQLILSLLATGPAEISGLAAVPDSNHLSAQGAAGFDLILRHTI